LPQHFRVPKLSSASVRFRDTLLNTAFTPRIGAAMALIRGRVAALLMTLMLCSAFAHAQQTTSTREKVIIDTDVGVDVDDACAIDLALASPELEVLGISSAWGDTALRARMIDRMLCETGRTEVAVNTGVGTHSTAPFTQAAWAR